MPGWRDPLLMRPRYVLSLHSVPSKSLKSRTLRSSRSSKAPTSQLPLRLLAVSMSFVAPTTLNWGSYNKKFKISPSWNYLITEKSMCLTLWCTQPTILNSCLKSSKRPLRTLTQKFPYCPISGSSFSRRPEKRLSPRLDLIKMNCAKAAMCAWRSRSQRLTNKRSPLSSRSSLVVPSFSANKLNTSENHSAITMMHWLLKKHRRK